jgi:hypothetical protein
MPILRTQLIALQWEYSQIFGQIYAASHLLFRYWMGLSDPNDILIRFFLYQRM